MKPNDGASRAAVLTLCTSRVFLMNVCMCGVFSVPCVCVFINSGRHQKNGAIKYLPEKSSEAPFSLLELFLLCGEVVSETYMFSANSFSQCMLLVFLFSCFKPKHPGAPGRSGVFISRPASSWRSLQRHLKKILY